ncbi:MAG: hypothetical protein AAF170_05025 [Bacteroidota bacterium]
MSDVLDKIYARCEVIAELVQQMQPMYVAPETHGYQRQHIETIIGAGLWYIPNKPLWTGRISLEAVKSHHPTSGNANPKLTEDHQYPRKVAAQKLLERDWSKDENPTFELTKMYLETFGRFNYVTPGENRALMPYQRAHRFESPELAYEEAGIPLISIESEQLDRVKARHAPTIEAIILGSV